jgi:hypothetical protein
MTGLMMGSMAVGQATPPSASSLPDEAKTAYSHLKDNVIKAAEKMPADAYSFKPTPDIRTFARVVNHVTEAQMKVCGAANHLDPSTAPKVPAETADKAAIVAALKASFVECDKAYDGLTEANMTDMFQPFGPAKRSRLGILWGNVAHDNEQYATLSLYLRLKGIVPPSSEK